MGGRGPAIVQKGFLAVVGFQRRLLRPLAAGLGELADFPCGRKPLLVTRQRRAFPDDAGTVKRMERRLYRSLDLAGRIRELRLAGVEFGDLKEDWSARTSPFLRVSESSNAVIGVAIGTRCCTDSCYTLPDGATGASEAFEIQEEPCAGCLDDHRGAVQERHASGEGGGW